jgi:hypothetical protein
LPAEIATEEWSGHKPAVRGGRVMLSVVCFTLYVAVTFTAPPSIPASFLWEDGSTPTFQIVLQVGDPLGGMSLGADGAGLPTRSLAGLSNDRSLVFSRPFDGTGFFESSSPTFREFSSQPTLPSQGWLQPPTEPETDDRIEDAVRAGR